MSIFNLVIRSFRFYLASNIAAASGIAIATAVICGAIIIGNSLDYSLLKIVDYRLNKTTHTITAGERIFTKKLAYKINDYKTITAAPILKTDAIVTLQDNAGARLNNVQVFGVDSLFNNLQNCSSINYNIEFGEAVINRNLANRLNLEIGDFILVRFKNIGAIPSNTPFVSEDNQTISRRIKIAKIANEKEGGNFNLQVSQSTPFNIFVNLDWLNRVLDLNNNANIIALDIEKEKNTDEIKNILKNNISLEDLNIEIKYNESQNKYLLRSKRVFFDNYLTEIITELIPDAEKHLTYFANSLESAESLTPYSFITATNSNRFQLKPNEIIINSWLSNDLNVKVGDSIILKYFKVGLLRELTEEKSSFLVSNIISLDEAVLDKIVMPHLPGLSDAGNCRDWDTGIPIDLKLIRDKDEDYWEKYKGTPKAYISLNTGQNLWENRFGNLTSFIIDGSEYSENHIRELIEEKVNPLLLEFQINEVRKKGIYAAKGGDDFSQLFAGLGMFIIISGLMLSVLLLSMSIKRREKQIELYNQLGFSKKLIQKIIMYEFSLISLFGVIIGMLISLGYSELVLLALNEIWNDIVRTNILTLHYNWLYIFIGSFISFVAGISVAFPAIRNKVKDHKTNQQIKAPKKKSRHKAALFLSIILLIFSVIAISYLLFTSKDDNVIFWFITGLSILLAVLLYCYYFVNSVKHGSAYTLSTVKLSLRNISRNPLRSLSIIVLLSLGSFILVVTASNRNNYIINISDKTGGTGGFSFFAETTVPILLNLNEESTQRKYGINNKIDFVQFLSVYDDDASCLNLNQVINPRILGVDPHLLENRFSFISTHKDLDKKNPWLSLNQDFEGIIPAIADNTVIRWGMGKSVGDTLSYLNSSGEEVKLLLIGGMANSIFQGNVIISQNNFTKNFPAAGGSNVFLLELLNNNKDESINELEIVFRDYGWNMIATDERLAEFNTVENTYLSIFFLMGALGMLIGTIGLAVVIAKTIIERNQEIALLHSIGIPSKLMNKIFIYEYSVLFFIGMFTGIIAGIIANLPVFITQNVIFSNIFLQSVIAILLLNGIIWIFTISHVMIKKYQNAPAS